jgi:hypothetical protein
MLYNRTYQDKGKNHKESSKSNLPQKNEEIKQLLTSKIKMYSGMYVYRKRRTPKRFYYHDNRYTDPWINVSNLQEKDWTYEKHALYNHKTKDLECINFYKLLLKKQEMIEKNFLVDLSEKSEAKTPKKPEKTEKFLCIRKKKTKRVKN